MNTKNLFLGTWHIIVKLFLQPPRQLCSLCKYVNTDFRTYKMTLVKQPAAVCWSLYCEFIWGLCACVWRK